MLLPHYRSLVLLAADGGWTSVLTRRIRCTLSSRFDCPDYHCQRLHIARPCKELLSIVGTYLVWMFLQTGDKRLASQVTIDAFIEQTLPLLDLERDAEMAQQGEQRQAVVLGWCVTWSCVFLPRL